MVWALGVLCIHVAALNAAPAANGTCEEALTTCAAYERELAPGLRLCPIFNGLWTSFLSTERWGTSGQYYFQQGASAIQPLPKEQVVTMIKKMISYDRRGLNVWVGEDFDARVMALLRFHARIGHHSKHKHANALSNSTYTIIVEREDGVAEGVQWLANILNQKEKPVPWLQLGPPLLQNDNLQQYKQLQEDGKVLHLGVEDFTADMIRQASSVIKVVSVQQEINLLVRPNQETQQLCRELGCQFVAYGPLLGGLMSDKYLGQPQPHPDDDHTKQWDYLRSIERWAMNVEPATPTLSTQSWTMFQQLLTVLQAVAHRQSSLQQYTVSQVALSYVLNLPLVFGAIVGIRIGESQHIDSNLKALQLQLTEQDIQEIESALQLGTLADGLARA